MEGKTVKNGARGLGASHYNDDSSYFFYWHSKLIPPCQTKLPLQILNQTLYHFCENVSNSEGVFFLKIGENLLKRFSARNHAEAKHFIHVLLFGFNWHAGAMTGATTIRPYPNRSVLSRCAFIHDSSSWRLPHPNRNRAHYCGDPPWIRSLHRRHIRPVHGVPLHALRYWLRFDYSHGTHPIFPLLFRTLIWFFPISLGNESCPRHLCWPPPHHRPHCRRILQSKSCKSVNPRETSPNVALVGHYHSASYSVVPMASATQPRVESTGFFHEGVLNPVRDV